MKQSRVDFAIIGATPLARLLAGLLATVHGKSVLFQGASVAGQRLPQGLDLSVAAITRPQSWALLAHTVPETTRLISRIGKRASVLRLDPILFADGAPGKQALAHVRHMAAAYGVAAERTPLHYLGPDRDGVMLRDAVLLRRAVLEPALDSWMAQSGVKRLPVEVPLLVQWDGRAECVLADETITIGQTILADDAAIVTHLAATDWPTLLQQQLASTILTIPHQKLAAPVLCQLDSGVMLNQLAGGGIMAHGPGAIDALSRALGTALGQTGVVRQAGQASFPGVITRDGAPAAGRLGGTGPDVLAGFGAIGAFLAPAIARWLCGQASASENDWFAAHLVDRNHADSRVSDIGAPR